METDPADSPTTAATRDSDQPTTGPDPTPLEADVSAHDLRVVCYARPSTLAEPVNDAVEALHRLRDRGIVDEVSVVGWPREVRLDDQTLAAPVLSYFERFDAWARQWNATITPPFELRERTSPVSGNQWEVLITPVLGLAVYAGGALVGVFPHTTGDRTYTVFDAVQALENGEVASPGAAVPPADAAADRDACPVCAGTLVNGQGLYTCTECGWTGTLVGAGRYRGHEPVSRPDPERLRDALR